MKNVYLILIFVFQFTIGSNGQTVLFSENFDDNYTSCFANSHPFTAWDVVDVGTQGSNANFWYIYYPENSIGGTGCDTTNQDSTKGALYISYGNICDSSLYGATFKKGCDNLTSKRVETPVISCSTATTAPILEFDFMANSIHNTDFASVLYSFNGGTDWDTLIQRLNTGRCYRVNSSGFWQHESITLPPSSVGNSDVKIAFAWTNNDDCVGAYVSVAIDNIKLFYDSCNIEILMDKGLPIEIPNAICENSELEVIIIQPSTTIATFQWSIDGTVFSTSNSISHSFTVGEHNLSLLVNTEECSTTLNYILVVEPTFSISVSTSDDDICLNECIDMTVTTSSYSGTFSYDWQFFNAIPDNSSLQNPIGICYDNPGSNLGLVTVSNNSTVCEVQTFIPVTVNACSYPYVTNIQATDDIFCQGELVNFSNNAVNETDYLWVFPNGTPSTSTDDSPWIVSISLQLTSHFTGN